MLRIYFENVLNEIPYIGIDFNGENRIVAIISVGHHCNEACGYTPVLIGFDDGSTIECPTGIFDTDEYQLQFRFEEDDNECVMGSRICDTLEVTYLHH